MTTTKPTRRPSRVGVPIKPHKGGRTARFDCRLTPAEREAVAKRIAASGLSASDWLMSLVNPKK